jgi:hypothetical protein
MGMCSAQTLILTHDQQLLAWSATTCMISYNWCTCYPCLGPCFEHLQHRRTTIYGLPPCSSTVTQQFCSSADRQTKCSNMNVHCPVNHLLTLLGRQTNQMLKHECPLPSQPLPVWEPPSASILSYGRGVDPVVLSVELVVRGVVQCWSSTWWGTQQ